MKANIFSSRNTVANLELGKSKLKVADRFIVYVRSYTVEQKETKTRVWPSFLPFPPPTLWGQSSCAAVLREIKRKHQSRLRDEKRKERKYFTNLSSSEIDSVDWLTHSLTDRLND